MDSTVLRSKAWPIMSANDLRYIEPKDQSVTWVQQSHFTVRTKGCFAYLTIPLLFPAQRWQNLPPQPISGSCLERDQWRISHGEHLDLCRVAPVPELINPGRKWGLKTLDDYGPNLSRNLQESSWPKVNHTFHSPCRLLSLKPSQLKFKLYSGKYHFDMIS